VLLIHGDDDRNVPFQQTTDLVEKLRAQNVAFEEIIIPDEIHDLLRWSDWIRTYRATAEFFDRRLATNSQLHLSRRSFSKLSRMLDRGRALSR
jgi:dipeptidyl aminopeptidase/acylaminoacyl peptidase